MCESIESIKLLQGLLVPLLAVFGAYIAWRQYVLAQRQYLLNENRLRLDLYDKRFQVYQGLNEMLLYLVKEARLPLEELRKFRLLTAQSTFLFETSSGIDEFLNRIDKQAVELYKLNRQLEDECLQHGVERDELARKENELLQMLEEQRTVSKDLFGKYLRPIE